MNSINKNTNLTSKHALKYHGAREQFGFQY